MEKEEMMKKMEIKSSVEILYDGMKNLMDKYDKATDKLMDLTDDIERKLKNARSQGYDDGAYTAEEDMFNLIAATLCNATKEEYDTLMANKTFKLMLSLLLANTDRDDMEFNSRLLRCSSDLKWSGNGYLDTDAILDGQTFTFLPKDEIDMWDDNADLH